MTSGGIRRPSLRGNRGERRVAQHQPGIVTAVREASTVAPAERRVDDRSARIGGWRICAIDPTWSGPAHSTSATAVYPALAGRARAKKPRG
jgi:hypothetical protein